MFACVHFDTVIFFDAHLCLFILYIMVVLSSIFFPNKRAPPTRSSFDYPRISQESTVFPSNSSPLLFSFGCMSPALGGEVRFFPTLLGCLSDVIDVLYYELFSRVTTVKYWEKPCICILSQEFLH